MKTKWVYREESKFIMLLPFLVLFLIGAAPLIAFVFYAYSGTIELSFSWFLETLRVLIFSAVFLLLAYLIYRFSLRTCLKSLFRNNPNCFIIDETGFYRHLNQQEILIQWHEIEAIYFTEYSIRGTRGYQKFHLKCHNGHEEIIDLHEFGSWQGQIFMPYLFLFGTVALFNKLLMVFWAVGMVCLVSASFYSKERKQQIIQIIHFYEYDKLLKGKAPHYYFYFNDDPPFFLHFDD